MSGDVEPLIVTALNNNKLDPIAFSPSNRYDVIYYDPLKGQSRYTWATNDDKGQIYRRITKNNNDIPYDVRAIRFRRYRVTLPNAWQGSTNYAVGNMVYRSSYIYRAMRANISEDPTGDITNTWRKIIKTSSFVGCTSSLQVFGSEGQFSVSCSLESFYDFYTFDDGSGVNQVDSSNVYNNVIIDNLINNFRALNNSIFFGSTVYDNIINNGFENNTITNHFFRNTIAGNFYENTIGFGNTNIASNSPFAHNTIGTNFHNNITAGSFNTNVIGHNFYGNIIDYIFEVNNIDNNFYNNTVSDYFYGNSIGSHCANNLINSHFEYNIVNIEFTNNIIGRFFYYNTFGQCFKYNKLDGYATSAASGSKFNYNDFGNGIQFSSFKDWGMAGETQFKGNYTVNVLKAESGRVYAQYYTNSNTFSTSTIILS